MEKYAEYVKRYTKKAKDSPEALLNQACIRGDIEEVKKLLANGVNPNYCDFYLYPPINAILKVDGGCNIDMLKFLLSANADVNASFDGYSNIVYLAVVHKQNSEVLELLIKAKGNVNAHGGIRGDTPLNAATARGNLGVMEMLINANADVNDACEKYHFTPVMRAIIHSTSTNCNALELLISAKADVNIPDADGTTPYQYAEEYGDFDVVELLLAAKANV
jgi:ankyrin repeat protein